MEKQVVSTVEAFERDLDEDSEPVLGADTESVRESGPYWEVSASEIQCVRKLLNVEPHCTDIFARFLAGSCKRSASVVLDTVKRLKLLNSPQEQIRSELQAIREKRGDEVGAALRVAGLPEGSYSNPWPDYESVRKYIYTSEDISLEEVIRCQQKALKTAKARKGAEGEARRGGGAGKKTTAPSGRRSKR
ncbi:hypothetical protein KFL_000910120 [Klebsormidium nitens]|uniref:Uncharacterized protein n=1 Tax=Klebsormidium nitens TaxID=105231 RepID=A0A1Y1HVF7_KLENI|nr:hypothetical protein KFL_000910120 [Klebsormidium nitens]|eukprot:GAQ81792.1 hypothetical protein KFL_000910120 [Klebsormidium nitens]